MRYAILIFGLVSFSSLLKADTGLSCYEVDYLGGQQLLLKITALEPENLFGNYQVQFWGNDEASNPIVVRLIQHCRNRKNCNLFEARGKDQSLVFRLSFNGVLQKRQGILSMEEPVRDRTAGNLVIKHREFAYREVACD